jgi:hypothetical protein
MRPNQYFVIVDFPATFPEIANQLFAALELGACRLIAIEIAHQTNPKRDIVQVITVDVPAIDLTPPTITHFDFAIAGRSTIADHEVIGQTVSHSAHVSMVIIKNACVSLTRAAIVDDDKLPAASLHGRATNFFDH